MPVLLTLRGTRQRDASALRARWCMLCAPRPAHSLRVVLLHTFVCEPNRCGGVWRGIELLAVALSTCRLGIYFANRRHSLLRAPFLTRVHPLRIEPVTSGLEGRRRSQLARLAGCFWRIGDVLCVCVIWRRCAVRGPNPRPPGPKAAVLASRPGQIFANGRHCLLRAAAARVVVARPPCCAQPIVRLP